MKTFKQFISEVSNAGLTPTDRTVGSNILAKRAGGGVGSFARNLLDPRTGPVSDATKAILRDVIAPRLPKPLQPVTRNLVAPVAGTAAGLSKYAPELSAAISVLAPKPTASGKVAVKGPNGKTYYMDK